MNKSKWIAFADRFPEPVAALDDPEITVTPVVLVTNNIDGIDRTGRPSNVWLASPQIALQDQSHCRPHYTKGNVIAFDDTDCVVINLTHWFDPFAEDEEVQSD